MAAIFKGTTVAVSFEGFVYTGYVAESLTISHPNGNVEVIRDADGATLTKIFQDPAEKIEATLVILAAGSITPPIDGATVGVIPAVGSLTSFMSEGSSATHAPGATRLNLSLIKEGSMTYV